MARKGGQNEETMTRGGNNGRQSGLVGEEGFFCFLKHWGRLVSGLYSIF